MAVTAYDVMPMTYLHGVLLGINAISDSYLWVDSPDCFFYKVDFIFGNHDLNSSLKRANGEHKFNSTISTSDKVIYNTNDEFELKLLNFANNDFIKVMFVSSMPMAQIIGMDYQMIIDNVKKNSKLKNIYNVPSRSMTTCWVDGYADLLFSLAKNIDISGAKPDNKKVAIIGNLFDRNEGDCIGNLEELKHIFEGLGLEVSTIWLNGGKYEDLLKVKEAGTIISLPYGRKAAKMLAKRLGIRVLELDVPFGFGNTIKFIENIGEYFSLNKEFIQDFIDKEFTIRNDITVLKWAINKTLFNKKITFYGDPYLTNGIIDISEYIGIDLRQVFIHGEKKHLLNNIDNIYNEYEYLITDSLLSDRDLNTDLFIMNTTNGSYWISYDEGQTTYDSNKILEFGFPSYSYHCFTNQPFYGVRGAINFVNRIYNKLSN